MYLQRTAGNAATTKLLHGGQRSVAPPGRGEEAAPERTSVQRWDPAAPPPTPEDKERLDDKLAVIAGNFKWLCLKQRDAVLDLHEDAKQVDPPPLWHSLLLGLGETALAAALGGVGGAVALKALSKLQARNVSEFIARTVSDAVKDATKKAAGLTFSGTVDVLSSSSTDSRVLFFRGQRDALTDLARVAENEFLSNGKSKIRESKDPFAQADALIAAQEESTIIAYQEQLNATLDEWANYSAANELGATGEGKDADVALGKQLGDTSAAGVLGIVINVTSPGTPPTIERAEMEGLNEGMRNVIASRPIKSLRVPVTVKGEVGGPLSWGEEWLEHKSRPTIKIGRTAQGTVWVNDTRGLKWLYHRSGPPESIGGRIPENEIWDGAFKGARLLIEHDLGDMTVGNTLSG